MSFGSGFGSGAGTGSAFGGTNNNTTGGFGAFGNTNNNTTSGMFRSLTQPCALLQTSTNTLVLQPLVPTPLPHLVLLAPRPLLPPVAFLALEALRQASDRTRPVCNTDL